MLKYPNLFWIKHAPDKAGENMLHLRRFKKAKEQDAVAILAYSEIGKEVR